MNDLVHIQNTDISVKEYRGQRVVTFKDIDTSKTSRNSKSNFQQEQNSFQRRGRLLRM